MKCKTFASISLMAAAIALLVACVGFTRVSAEAAVTIEDRYSFQADIMVGGNPTPCVFTVVGDGEVYISNNEDPAIDTNAYGHLEIPDSVIDESSGISYRVTGLDTGCFFACGGITSTNLVDTTSITYLGKYCLAECSGLTNEAIPLSLKNDYPSENCPSPFRFTLMPQGLQSIYAMGDYNQVIELDDRVLVDMYYRSSNETWAGKTAADAPGAIRLIPLSEITGVNATVSAPGNPWASTGVWAQGETVTLTAVAPDETAVFDHWDCSDPSASIEDVSAPTTVAQIGSVDATFTAVYAYPVTYVVSGDIPDGYVVPVDDTIYAEGASVAAKPVPLADGYEFTGWSVDGTVVDEATMPRGGLTFQGVWTKTPPIPPVPPLDKFRVTYLVTGDIPQGYTPPSTSDVFEVGAFVKLADVPRQSDYPGYSFTGWRVADVESAGAIMREGGLTAVGSWVKDDYAVSVQVDEGVIAASNVYLNDGTAPEPVDEGRAVTTDGQVYSSTIVSASATGQGSDTTLSTHPEKQTAESAKRTETEQTVTAVQTSTTTTTESASSTKTPPTGDELTFLSICAIVLLSVSVCACLGCARKRSR